MQTMRWVNPQHPQTLNIGVILLYIDAVFLVIGGSIASGLGLLLAIGSVAAAAGIANDKRIAWYAGVAISAIVPILLLLSLRNNGLDTLFDTGFLLGAVFPIAQFAALIHPMSQSHVKAWFE